MAKCDNVILVAAADKLRVESKLQDGIETGFYEPRIILSLHLLPGQGLIICPQGPLYDCYSKGFISRFDYGSLPLGLRKLRDVLVTYSGHQSNFNQAMISFRPPCIDSFIGHQFHDAEGD